MGEGCFIGSAVEPLMLKESIAPRRSRGDVAVEHGLGESSPQGGCDSSVYS